MNTMSTQKNHKSIDPLLKDILDGKDVPRSLIVIEKHHFLFLNRSSFVKEIDEDMIYIPNLFV